MSETRLILIFAALAICVWQIFVRGEDWYDVWFGPPYYSWFSGFGDFFRCVLVGSGIIIVLGFINVVVPPTAAPAYAESTPIKISSQKPVSQQKARAKNKKTTVKRHAKAPGKASA